MLYMFNTLFILVLIGTGQSCTEIKNQFSISVSVDWIQTFLIFAWNKETTNRQEDRSGTNTNYAKHFSAYVFFFPSLSHYLAQVLRKKQFCGVKNCSSVKVCEVSELHTVFPLVLVVSEVLEAQTKRSYLGLHFWLFFEMCSSFWATLYFYGYIGYVVLR